MPPIPFGWRYQAAVNAGDAVALASLFAADAEIMDPDVPATRGIDAIRGTFERSFANADFSEMIIEHLELEPLGEVLLTIGTSSVVIHPRGGKPTRERSKFFAISRRQPDGSLKIWRVLSASGRDSR
ncbi:MAG: DUF4440 domain-containing protein [Gemmatimonadales bacterium]